MTRKSIMKMLVCLLLVGAIVLPQAAVANASGGDLVMVQVGERGPGVPGKQEADPDFSGSTAVLVAGQSDLKGNLAIHFTDVTVAKLLISKKPLKLDMVPADLTLSAANIKEIASKTGRVFTLQIKYEDAAKVGGRTAITDQIEFGFKNVDGDKQAVNFTGAAKLKFNVNSSAANWYGAKEESGQWKTVSGKKGSNFFTINMKKPGNYAVVSN
ncbi:hypothetical protein [Planococcus sp. YIM B11945]|uniref:hypothetical protein n=1 Tax=Planococcus sp. YIM B11945 TaxID=3435410 RepID=UPI003D7CB534